MRLSVLPSPAPERTGAARARIALLGPPNVGKSAIFGRLVGFDRRSANALGTTQDSCTGCVTCKTAAGDGCERRETFDLVDLPGVFSLEHGTAEARLCRATLGIDQEASSLVERADAVAIVIEALDPEAGLRLVSQAARAGLPTVVVVNMMDEATRSGVEVRAAELGERLGCPVVAVSAKRSTGLAELRSALEDIESVAVPARLDEHEVAALASRVVSRSAGPGRVPIGDRLADGFDAIATHPVFGAVLFVLIALASLRMVFLLAEAPSGWFEGSLLWLGGVVAGALPAGFFSDLIGEGVLGGVGGVVVFVPQIALTFVAIALLEQSGYLVRASLAVDRLFRPFGLSGRAFMPMLASYGCAIPAIIAARSIPCRRERLATMMAIPFTGCPARIPVYVLVASALFPGSGFKAAMAILVCYAAGAAAALLTALLVRRTIARGPNLPMIVELPPYRLPSVFGALRLGGSRSLSFLKRAGTIILAASVVMWGLERVRVGTDDAGGQVSAMDAIGGAVQPAFRPLGFDDDLTVATLVSFAARELFVSSMAIQRGVDAESAEEPTFRELFAAPASADTGTAPDPTPNTGADAGREPAKAPTLRERLATAERADGSLVFDAGTSWAVLLFFALSTQCLSTLAITAKEARSWKVPVLQFVWAFALAYGAAALVRAVVA